MYLYATAQYTRKCLLSYVHLIIFLNSLLYYFLQMFETYLQFVGIAITNAQIMEASRQEYERNRVKTENKCNYR